MGFVIWSIFSRQSIVVQIKNQLWAVWTCALKIICNLNNKLDDQQNPLTHAQQAIKSGAKVFYDSSFREVLQYPVCLEIPLPPIYVCIIGHHVCKDCLSKIHLCPVCRSKFPESNQRNFALEVLILASHHECRYINLGCQICPLGELMDEHVKNCKYRPMVCRCPLLGLQNCWKHCLEINEIKEHIKDYHDAKIHSISNSFVRKLDVLVFEFLIFCAESGISKSLMFRPDIIEFDGNIFLIQMYAHIPNQFYLFILYFGKTIDNKQKYGVNITIQSNKKMYDSIRWRNYEILQASDIGNIFEEDFVVPVDSMRWPQCDFSNFKHLSGWNRLCQSYIITMEYEFFRIP